MKYLVFDLDDTLIPSAEAYEQAYRSIGIDPESQEFLTARARVKSRLPHQHPSARNRWLYLKEYLECKHQFSPRDLFSLMTQYEKVLEEYLHQQWHVLKRDRLFEQLGKRAKLSVLTNENTRQQVLKLKVLDPEFKYFSGLLTSEEVGFEKPHLKIFEEQRHLLSGVRAENIYMIGNEVETDLAPAHELGWNTVLTLEFSQNKKSAQHSFHHTIERLDELLGLI